eukprot:1147864-Pelagomonas_calceolata.AAC.9
MYIVSKGSPHQFGKGATRGQKVLLLSVQQNACYRRFSFGRMLPCTLACIGFAAAHTQQTDN